MDQNNSSWLPIYNEYNSLIEEFNIEISGVDNFEAHYFLNIQLAIPPGPIALHTFIEERQFPSSHW